MGEDRRIDILKKECYELYQFKDDRYRYEQAVGKLEQRITELGLNKLVDPIEFSFLLLSQTYPFPENIEHFKHFVDRFLKCNKTSFFFQLPQLVGFPDEYPLGHGNLRNFDSLPTIIKDFAKGLTEGKVGKVRTEEERIQTVRLREMSIPTNPRAGCWLETIEHGISHFIMFEKALQEAEESLNILRILRPHIRISLPHYVISKNSREKKVSFNTLKLESYPYHFDQQEQKLICRLNQLVLNPSSELEKRVVNALRFYRIGQDMSTEEQSLFYFVAAIENLVIGGNDRDVLRWKFSEKAAFLLEDDLIGRLDVVKKLRSLYDARSTIAHGNISYSEGKATLARDYLVRIITRILELIDERGIKSVSSHDKEDSLDKYIDQIKYSGEPSPVNNR